jgi:hypothetical protein
MPARSADEVRDDVLRWTKSSLCEEIVAATKAPFDKVHTVSIRLIRRTQRPMINVQNNRAVGEILREDQCKPSGIGKDASNSCRTVR